MLSENFRYWNVASSIFYSSLLFRKFKFQGGFKWPKNGMLYALPFQQDLRRWQFWKDDLYTKRKNSAGKINKCLSQVSFIVKKRYWEEEQPRESELMKHAQCSVKQCRWGEAQTRKRRHQHQSEAFRRGGLLKNRKHNFSETLNTELSYDLLLGVCPTDLKVEAQTGYSCVHSSIVHRNHDGGETAKAKGAHGGSACTHNRDF